MEKLIKDVLQSENGEELEVKGLISDLSEGLTKTGKPFVNGSLFAKGKTITFKVWDIGLEEFKNEKGVGIGSPVICHGAININPQNGEKQIVLRDGNEMPYLSILDEAEVAELAQATKKPIKDMRNAILGAQVVYKYLPELEDEEELSPLHRVALRAMQEVEAASEAPYSCEIRHYRGGFIEHLYNVIFKMLYPVGLPWLKEDVDWGVIYIAVLLYHVGWVKRTKINFVTGLVEEKDETGPIEKGSDGLCDYTFAISLFEEKELTLPRVRNLVHVVASLNGLAQPASFEAAIANEFVKGDLRAQVVAEATSGLAPDTKGLKVVNGEVKKFINY